jgi:heterodisulfide reductase subunit A
VSQTRKTVLVVGGGMAGACAALELAEAGVQVELIEKSPFIGGHAVNITCKALDSCQHCNGCLVDPKMEQVQGHALINIHTRTRLTKAEPQNGGYALTLETGPAYLDAELCTNCGVCLEQCPQPGAIARAPYAGDRVKLAIDPEKCLYFKDDKSTICRDACPVEAIDFKASASQKELKADAVIMATGFKPYDVSQKARLGYGRIPGVITALELEKGMRRNGKALRPSDDEPAKRVAFVQCVGSRERKGHNYCSRVCCAYALRLGRALKRGQDAEVSIFHMDLQSFGSDFDAYLEKAREELNLVRAMPYDVLPGDKGGAKVVYQATPGTEPLMDPFDLVVLSQAITPQPESDGLLEAMGLGHDENGFLTPNGGVFVAGTAGSPMDLSEVAASASQASQQALAYLEVS